MPTSLRYRKLSEHGSVTRLARPKKIPAGFLVAFYDGTGRWLGQLSGDTVKQAQELATKRKLAWESCVFQKC